MSTYVIPLDASTTIPTAEAVTEMSDPPRECVTRKRSRTTNSADHLSERLSPQAVDYVNEVLGTFGGERLDPTEATASRARKRIRQAFRAYVDDYRPEIHAAGIRENAVAYVREAMSL